jgi:hypothetical protein
LPDIQLSFLVLGENILQLKIQLRVRLVLPGRTVKPPLLPALYVVPENTRLLSQIIAPAVHLDISRIPLVYLLATHAQRATLPPAVLRLVPAVCKVTIPPLLRHRYARHAQQGTTLQIILALALRALVALTPQLPHPSAAKHAMPESFRRKERVCVHPAHLVLQQPQHHLFVRRVPLATILLPAHLSVRVAVLGP